MFLTKIKTTTIMLLVPAFAGILLTAYSSMKAGQSEPVPAGSIPPVDLPTTPKKSLSKKDSKDKSAEPDPAPSIGFVHDFGKVESGTLAKHALRIFNTSQVPLRIISLRVS